MRSKYLNQNFLIAMPSLDDPNFKQGVTLLCQHNAEGALGLTINHASSMQLQDIFQQMDIQCESVDIAQTRVLTGGPLQPERGFVLHDGHPDGDTEAWESSLQLNEQLFLSTSRDILIDIAANKGPDNFIIALGYAGWQAGQLESELRANSWLNCSVNNHIIFDAPLHQRWRKALDTMGIQRPEQLSSSGGRA